jgi:hypothetical protein
MPSYSYRIRGARPPGAITLVLVLLLVSFPVAALAGSICGNITDADSGLPVEGAGIFARHSGGAYAGALAVSDAVGDWCIDDLAPGIYTLEIRVDNYVTTFVNGIAVTDDISDVPLTVARAAVTFDPPWPNPSSSGVNLRLHVGRPTNMDLEIYDARGRLVQSWTASSSVVGTRDYFWDGKDKSGRPAPAGLYLVRVRSLDAQTTRPLILTR